MSTAKLMSAGVLTAIAASLCCITPVLALIAGSSSIASSFSWIEPARPYLIVLTVGVLGFAWYQKLRPKVDECGCAIDEKPKFLQSKTFLVIVTVFAGLMVAFPYYSKFFFPKNNNAVTVADKSNIQIAELSIKGMSCESCEAEVNHEVNKLPGIIKSEVSYEKKNAVIEFDISKTTIEDIIQAVNKTGYTVTKHSIKNKSL